MVSRIERFRPTAGHAPFDFRRRLRNRRRGDGGSCHANSGGFDKVTALHGILPVGDVYCPAFLSRLDPRMEHPARDFHDELR
jgi:hypothetical protein